jgi:hypothetical protein
VATATSSYTAGCILDVAGLRRLGDQAAIDATYRLEDGHFTRSYVHSVMQYGGLGQEMLDNGERLFTGNSATDFGTLVDRAIPMVVCGVRLEDYYAVPPEAVLSNGARRGKAYTEWKEQLGAKLEVSAADWYRLKKIIDNVCLHPAASEILEETEDCQACFRWIDPSGYPRKALADGVTPHYLWDFKTTSSDWKDLYRSCMNFGYLAQDAWYEDGAVANGWPPHRLKFVFAQTQKPYAVRVYTMPQDMVDLARERLAVTLDQIALRRELGLYRGPEDEEVLELEFPSWTRGERE